VKVDADISKQVSPMNPHVLEATPQVLKVINNILPMKLQLSKVLKVQPLELQVLNIETLEVQVSKVHVSNIKTSKV